MATLRVKSHSFPDPAKKCDRERGIVAGANAR
jgi:hypothetical protein